jgi:hypothetical protein
MASDKDVIARFVVDFNVEFGTGFRVDEHPDEQDRTTKAIDAIAVFGHEKLGIEHTLLQPFSGERDDANVFLHTIGKLDRLPMFTVPGEQRKLLIKVGAVPRGAKWDVVATDLKKWYASIHPTVCFGLTTHTVSTQNCEIDITVRRTKLAGARGYFHVARWLPKTDLTETVRRALDTKLEKLVAAQVTRRLLLFEQNVPVRGSEEIYAAIETLESQYPAISQLESIWLADTSALHDEDYVSFEIVWPLKAASQQRVARSGRA